MRIREIRELVASTSDSAFAVDASGQIVAWNQAAEAMMGLPAGEVMGKPCAEIIHGTDECGPVCSPDCTVKQAIRKHHAIGNFDLQIQTAKGKQWCNIPVLIAGEPGSTIPYSIHIIRQIADQLHISRTTVNNHIQRILRKLNAHSRLEALRRAEHARLI